jgi:RepB DNA-primase from phage plasmid
METENVRRYLQDNFRPEDRLAVVLLNKRTHSVIQRLAAAEAITAHEFQEWLMHQNAERYEVYISMNALAPTAKGRTKADVGAIRHVYLDFDTDGTAAVEALLKRSDLPRPNYLINTSPDKWQVVWKAEGFAKLQAETLQRGLARECGADSAATDCARVLRLPGFVNHKYARPHLVRAEMLAHETYRWEHFPEVSGEERTDRSHLGEKLPVYRRSRPPGALSQSERDWAYAKRALARGESPALVVAAIASYRRYEKHNPQDYAERTVNRAAHQLQRERTPDTVVEPDR